MTVILSSHSIRWRLDTQKQADVLCDSRQWCSDDTEIEGFQFPAGGRVYSVSDCENAPDSYRDIGLSKTRWPFSDKAGHREGFEILWCSLGKVWQTKCGERVKSSCVLIGGTA